ncbi:MAG: hypothetical protein FJX74_15375 [Armatimonadetes bacterium]|nr:hypothetical protein [Armatimonadota bacterium]
MTALTLPVRSWSSGTRGEFVRYWEPFYWRFETREALYTEHIGKPYTPSDVRALFRWKNGMPLATKKAASVERHFVHRLDELHSLSESTPATEFLERWPHGGAVWRVFWLHLWQPRLYPILDQHVYRALSCIGGWASKEIPTSDTAKLTDYFALYLPQWKASGFKDREDDRALWAFGKYLRSKWNESVGHLA